MLTSTLLGRDAPLAALTAMLNDVCAGAGTRAGGRLAFLAGEPGIGKTTLADALSAYAQQRGAQVTWGRAWESGGAPAYWPWTQALESLLRTRSDDDARAIVERAGADAARLVPSFASVLEGAATAGTDAESARFAVGRALAALIAALTTTNAARTTSNAAVTTPDAAVGTSAGGALLIVLDDLHAADLGTLHALRFVARELRTLPVLIVGTLRDVEARMDDDKAALLAAIERDGTTLSLARLARDDTATLARRVARDAHVEIDDVTELAIWQATRGNPLFVDEVARMIAKDTPSASSSSSSSLSLSRPRVPIPFGVREIIRQRVALVGGADRDVLDIVAVAGDDVALAVLAVVARRTLIEIDATLDRLARAGALAPRALEEVPRFSHALFREVVERDLPASRRASLHRATANALEARAPRGHLVEVAHHRLAARDEHPDEALVAVENAVASLIARGAYDDALALARRAAAEIVLEPGSALAVRGELVVGDALIAAGQERDGVDACARAAASAQRALAAAHDAAHGMAAAADVARLLARAALSVGRAWTFGAANSSLVQLLESARTALADTHCRDDALLARIEARLAGAMQPAADASVPIALARRAIARARASNDDGAILDAIHSGMSAMMDYVDPVDRMPLNSELLERAERAGDRAKALRARTRLLFDLVELGELEAADDAIDAIEVVASEIGHPIHTWVVPMMRAMLALPRGDMARHAALFAEAQTIAKGIGERHGFDNFALHAWGAPRSIDDVEGMRRQLPAMIAAIHMGPPGFIDFVIGWSAWRVGDLDEARRRFAAHPRIPMHDPSVAALVAEALADVGARQLAEDCLAELGTRKRRLFSFGMSAYIVELPVEHYEAHLLRALGRFDEARACHAGALAFAREIGAHGFVPRLQRALATCPSSTAQLVTAKPPAAIQPSPKAVTFTREGDTWRIDGGAAPVRMKDGRGLQILSVLVARAGDDVGALDLMNARDGVNGAADGGADGAIDLGDAGEMLDDKAKQRYRARLRDIDAALDDEQPPVKRERLLAEKEALVRELARGLGLGGRARRTGGAAERARVAVQRRVRDAIEKVRAQDAALGAHLDRCVRTGAFCCYRP